MSKQKDLFQKLLRQIKFPTSFPDNEIVQAGEIQDVDVYPEKKTWLLHVFFETPLEFATYEALSKAVAASFEPDVKAGLVIKTATGDPKFLPDYWRYMLDHDASLPKLTAGFLHNEKPDFLNDQWIITVQNQVEAQALDEHTLLQLGLEYRKYGFFNVKFVLKKDRENSRENLQSLEREQAEHEAKLQKIHDEMPPAPPQPAPAPAPRR